MCYNSFHKVIKSNEKNFQKNVNTRRKKRMKKLNNVGWKRNDNFSMEGFRRKQKLSKYLCLGSFMLALIWGTVVVILMQAEYSQENVGVTIAIIVIIIMLRFIAFFLDRWKLLYEMRIADKERTRKWETIVKCLINKEFSKLKLIDKSLQQRIFQQSIISGKKGGVFLSISLKSYYIVIKQKGYIEIRINIFDDEELLSYFDIEID